MLTNHGSVTYYSRKATGGKLAIPQPPQTIAELALAIGMQCCGIASKSSSIF